MSTPANPLQVKQSNPTPSIMDLLLGGIPATSPTGSTSGAATSALAQMLGPGSNLSPYLKLGGVQYGEQLDDLMTNPLAAWY